MWEVHFAWEKVLKLLWSHIRIIVFLCIWFEIDLRKRWHQPKDGLKERLFTLGRRLSSFVNMTQVTKLSYGAWLWRLFTMQFKCDIDKPCWGVCVWSDFGCAIRCSQLEHWFGFEKVLVFVVSERNGDPRFLHINCSLDRCNGHVIQPPYIVALWRHWIRWSYTLMWFERERFTLHLGHRLSSYVNPTHDYKDKATLCDLHLHWWIMWLRCNIDIYKQLFFLCATICNVCKCEGVLFLLLHFFLLKFWTIYCTQEPNYGLKQGNTCTISDITMAMLQKESTMAVIGVVVSNEDMAHRRDSRWSTLCLYICATFANLWWNINKNQIQI